MKKRHLLVCLLGLILSSGWGTSAPSYQADRTPRATQTAPQRTLVEGTDYELSSDRKGLASWMAEDLATVDFTQDPILAKLEYIDARAFMMRSSVEYVILPETLTSIREMAFYYSGLKEITLPKDLHSLGVIDGDITNPFAGCSNFETIHLSPENTHFKLVDGVLFSASGKDLLVYPAGLATSSYKIPSGVTSVIENSFAGTTLKEVICPKSLREIAPLAFEDADLLENITLNEGLTAIGWGAFKNTQIATLTLPKSLQIKPSAGEYENPFLGMVALTSFTIAEGGNFHLKDKALYLADRDVLIALPPSSGHTAFALGAKPAVLAQGAFAYHKTLETFSSMHHVAIPLRAFDCCTKLRKVELQSGTPFIATQAFIDCDAMESLIIGAPFVPVLEDEDAFSSVSAARFVLHIPASLEISAFEKSEPWQAVLKKIRVQGDAETVQNVVLQHGKYHSLGATFTAESFRSSSPSIALLTEKGDQIVGNIVGTASIYLGKEGRGSLLFVQVAPTEAGMVAEPWLDRFERSFAAIEQYEKNVAHRKVVKEEPQFGGRMFTFADETRPGVSVTYLFFGDVASEYATVVFDTKELYATHKMDTFLQERYAPAMGTDLDGETFDGFVRPDGVGYEYRELNVSEDASAVINVAYFFSDSYAYKSSPLPTDPVIASEKIGLRVMGDQLLLPRDVESVALYRLDGILVLHSSQRQATSISLAQLPAGVYLAVVCRTGYSAPLILKLMR